MRNLRANKRCWLIDEPGGASVLWQRSSPTAWSRRFGQARLRQIAMSSSGPADALIATSFAAFNSMTAPSARACTPRLLAARHSTCEAELRKAYVISSRHWRTHRSPRVDAIGRLIGSPSRPIPAALRGEELCWARRSFALPI